MSKKKVYVQYQQPKQKGGCISIFFAFIVIGGIMSLFQGNKKTENDNDVSTTEVITTEHIKEISNEEQFISDFSKYESKEIAKKIYDIYTKEIGFKEIELKEKIEGTTNYKIAAESYSTMITIIGDNDYRIFIPNSSFVFYENNQVMSTYEELKNKTVDSYDFNYYYVIAKTIVKDTLKNPKSADFPPSNEISYQKDGDLIALQGYVYAENSFGATVKSDWVVQFYVYDLENFSYSVQYINIEGNTSGEFIPFE